MSIEKPLTFDPPPFELDAEGIYEWFVEAFDQIMTCAHERGVSSTMVFDFVDPFNREDHFCMVFKGGLSMSLGMLERGIGCIRRTCDRGSTYQETDE